MSKPASENPHDLPTLISVSQFLERVPISRTTFWRLQKDNKGPRMKRIGQQIFMTEKDALEWFNSLDSA